MRFAILAALATAVALGGCMGPQGNPNGQPYADEPGGTLAVKPQFLGVEQYDPYGKPAPFADMDIGGPAINPTTMPPSPMQPVR